MQFVLLTLQCGRFRQGDKFFVNDGGNLSRDYKDAWRTGQHLPASVLE